MGICILTKDLAKSIELCLVAFAFACNNNAIAKVPVAVIGNDQNVVKLEVAETPQEIQQGLMYRTSVPDDTGMVFLFHPPRVTRFWMYHTLIPLDMIFVRDGKIVKICPNVPPCRSENPHECTLYPAEGDITVSEVVEVNGTYCRRHGIKQGDTIRFSLDSP